MNKFCRYLSNSIRIEYGQLRPCCWFNQSVNLNDTVAVTDFLSNVESIDQWNIHTCSECLMREHNKEYSPRLESFKRKSLEGITDNSKAIIEIQIDRDCNAACLICSSSNSTTWEKYENKINNISIREVIDHKPAMLAYIEQIVKAVDFSQAKELLFLGGEPLRTDSHLELLKLIKHPENISIRYTTNGSYRPTDDVLKEWRRYKEVRVQFSIDGTEEHFNYLRWPLQWSQVENNLKFLQTKPLDNIVISPFSYTVTPFSLYYHDRYIQWATDLFGDGEAMLGKHGPWQPRGDIAMSLTAVPPELQTVIREKYGVNHYISKLLEPYNPSSLTKFQEYVNYHDQHRQTNWREVFPEMVKYFT